MQIQNILVTGANGQLGTELQLLAPSVSHYKFFFTDVPELDILNIEAIEQFTSTNNIQGIINCAAYTAVDRAETDQKMAYKINAEGPENLAKVAAKKNMLFIHVSTDFVFDGANHRPYVETDVPSPCSVYGETKWQGEKLVMQAHANSIILRTSWLYSAHGNNFVKTMLRLGNERDSLGVIFDQIGTPTWAKDLALSILKIIDHHCEGNTSAGVYHFSNEGVASWYDFTKTIMEIAHISCAVNPIETKAYPTPARRPHYSVLNKAKIKSTFNLEIPYWKDSLVTCIDQLING